MADKLNRPHYFFVGSLNDAVSISGRLIGNHRADRKSTNSSGKHIICVQMSRSGVPL